MKRNLYYFIIIVIIVNLSISQLIASNNKMATTNQKELNTNNFQTKSISDSIVEIDTLKYDEQEISAIKENFKNRMDLPFRGIENIASTYSGVSKQDNSSLLNIRGGLSSQTKIRVDGMLVNNPYNNSVNIYLPNEIIENMVINKNSLDVNDEYANQINVFLPERYDKYYGFVKALSDGFLSTKNKTLGTYSYGYNEYLMAIGGPIIPEEKHSFFLSTTRRWLQDYKPSWGWAENDFKPDAFKESIIPGNTNSEWSIVAKAKYNLFDNINITGNLFWTDRIFSDINPLFLYNPEHASYWSTNHRSYRISWNHTINPNLSYQVGFKHFSEFRENYDRFFKDDLWAYGDPRFNPLPDMDQNYGIPYSTRIEPDFFSSGGQYNNYYKNKSNYYGFDLGITHQLNQHHKLKLGFDYKKHTLREYRMLDPVQLATKSNLTDLERYRLADVRFYGYDLQGNEVDYGDYFDVKRDATTLTPIGDFDKQAPYEPIVMGSTLNDKIEYGDLVLNLGLRYDRIDPNAWQFKNQEAQLNENGNIIPGTGMFGGNEMFDESDIEDSEIHEFVSPRIGARFKIDHTISLFANYGKYIHSPNWSNLYLSPFYLDSWVNRGGYFTTFNNPNLEPGKTNIYELGMHMSLNNNIDIKSSLFYQDIYNLPTYIPIQTDLTELVFPQNSAEYTSKGIDVELVYAPSENFFINFNYELRFSDDTGFASATNFYIAWQDGSANFPQSTLPIEIEQYHTGIINLVYRLKENQGPKLFNINPFENTIMNLLASFNSGKTYTKWKATSTLPFSGRYDIYGMYGSLPYPYSNIKIENTPNVIRFDLKFSKKFNLPLNTYLKASISVLNLFNSEIINDVWLTTGKPNETGYLDLPVGQDYWASLTENDKKNFKLREMDFNNYGNPRQLRFELELGF